MTPLARILLALIAVALGVGVVAWLVRYQPFGPSEPMGTPLPTDAAAAAGWTPLTDAPFARLEMATAVHDGRIWLAGGFAPDGSVVGHVAILDPATGAWTDGPPLPAAIHHAAMASDGGVLYLVGGYLGATGQPTDEVWVLNPPKGEWVVGPPLPQARAAGALAFDGSRLVYAGGVGPGGVRAEIFALDASGEGWLAIGELARAREHLAAASDGAGRTWFMGGRQGGLDRNVGDVELVARNEIRLIASVTPRGGVAAFHAPGIGACLTGGEAPSFAFATVECVDESGRVTALPDMAQRRHGHGVAVVDGVAYALLGGEIQGLNTTATVESLPIGE
jgi:serine/threonine-protein kinase PknK